MATDATGTPSPNFGIPTFNTSVDAPSGVGGNGQVAAIDTLLAKGFVIMSAKGDIVYSSAANVAARLPIGTTGQVLTVAGGVPTWAAAGGGANVATTVGGLPGSPTAGMLGRLRMGSTPFDFQDLVYDTTLTKWVSPVRPIFFLASTGLSANNTANVWAATGASGLIPYGAWITAGLTLQIRLSGIMGSSGTTDAGVVMQTGAVAGSLSAATADVANATVVGASAIYDTGWIAAPVPTSNTLALFTIRGRNTINNTGQWSSMNLDMRWVA